MTHEQLNELKSLVNKLRPDEYQPDSWHIGDLDTARAVGRFVTMYGQMPLNPATGPWRNPLLVIRLLWRNLTQYRPSVKAMEAEIKQLRMDNDSLSGWVSQLQKDKVSVS